MSCVLVKNELKRYADRYYTDITYELDKLIVRKNKFGYRLHYIILSEFSLKNRCLAIRTQGCTIGGISYDENNIITRIHINMDGYNGIHYDENTLDEMKKYIGQELVISTVKKRGKEDE